MRSYNSHLGSWGSGWSIKFPWKKFWKVPDLEGFSEQKFSNFHILIVKIISDNFYKVHSEVVRALGTLQRSFNELESGSNHVYIYIHIEREREREKPWVIFVHRLNPPFKNKPELSVALKGSLDVGKSFMTTSRDLSLLNSRLKKSQINYQFTGDFVTKRSVVFS